MTEHDRLVAALQAAITAALELSGMPRALWGEIVIRTEAGRVTLPVRFVVTVK